VTFAQLCLISFTGRRNREGVGERRGKSILLNELFLLELLDLEDWLMRVFVRKMSAEEDDPFFIVCIDVFFLGVC